MQAAEFVMSSRASVVILFKSRVWQRCVEVLIQHHATDVIDQDARGVGHVVSVPIELLPAFQQNPRATLEADVHQLVCCQRVRRYAVHAQHDRAIERHDSHRCL